MVLMIHRNLRGKEGTIKQTESKISYQGAVIGWKAKTAGFGNEMTKGKSQWGAT